MYLRSLIYLSSMVLGTLLPMAIVQAQQVRSDGSLNTIVNSSNGRDFVITGGGNAGTNLFHSFSQFSVPTGGSAVFEHAPDLRNIFSRVTGGNGSNIDGLIQTQGSANLFLLNPSGILFGPNALLNVGGSFVGTTAQSIKFADGVEFGVAKANSPPLLTITVPIGLQMSSNSSSIQIQGNGNDGIFPTTDLGLVSTPGRSMILLGNGINLTGGVVTAPAGRLELGSVSNGEVQLNATPIGWQLGYTGIQDFADIQLSQRSALWNPYPVGNSFAGMQVVGHNITLDKSQITAATLGDQSGGNVQILAQGKLRLNGYDPDIPSPSSMIANYVLPGANAAGGNIIIQARQIEVLEGGEIGTNSLGNGESGAIEVAATQIYLSGSRPYISPIFGSVTSSSAIISSSYSNAKSGDILVNADQIEMYDAGRVSTFLAPTASGNGGNITVNARRILATGVDNAFGSSGIQALASGSGRGGNVKVNTQTIELTEGGIINTFAYRFPKMPGSGSGNAGSVEVNASQRIDLVGPSPTSPSQTAFLGSATTGTGNSGDVTVMSPMVSIRDGASLTTGTAAIISIFGDPTQFDRLGDGGNLTLRANQVELIGVNPLINNGSSLGAFTFGNGNAGNVDIIADRINIQDGANIVSTTLASGNTGQLTIEAREINLSGTMAGRQAAIISSAEQFDPAARKAFGLPDVPTGSTDRLLITADVINMSNQSKISTAHRGTGNAGDLILRTKQLTLNDRAEISATTLTGDGGNADLQVRDSLLLRQNSKISVESAGIGNGGNIKISAPIILGVANSDIIANAFLGQGGNIQIATQGLIGLQNRPQLTAASDITASSRFGVNGTVQVNNIGVDPNSGLTVLPVDIVDPSQKIATGCANQQTGSFVVTGRGGMPVNPVEHLVADRLWQDVRAEGLPLSNSPSKTLTMNSSPLIEATTWQLNRQGQTELVATNPVMANSLAITCAK
jgi:filamentous hemagglutinin family protein